MHGRKSDKKINEFACEGVKAKDGSVCEVILCFLKVSIQCLNEEHPRLEPGEHRFGIEA